jgi:hypothetical protein
LRSGSHEGTRAYQSLGILGIGCACCNRDVAVQFIQMPVDPVFDLVPRLYVRGNIPVAKILCSFACVYMLDSVNGKYGWFDGFPGFTILAGDCMVHHMVGHGYNCNVAVIGKVCVLLVKYLAVNSGMGEFEITWNDFKMANGEVGTGFE